jgi:outer membrane protein OmpA-like peptidoglycan-associated protein
MRRRASIRQDETLWFVSYSDLITAILAVLVLMMSFSKIDIEKVDHANRLMKDDKLVTLVSLKTEYEQIILEKNLADMVSVALDKEGLTINAASTVQFKSNSATLDAKGIELLKPVMEKLVEDSQKREITIIGHTDDTGSRERNWDLSSQRAYSILEYLMKVGLVSEHAKLVAYGPNKPLHSINTLTNSDQIDAARAENRRVSIIIGKSF